MDQRQKLHNLLQQAHQAQQLGRMDEAARLYQNSLKVRPTAEAYTFLGWTSSLRGNLEKAIALCRQAIRMDPELGDPYSDIGAYLVQLERFDEASSWLRKAARARRYLNYYLAHYNLGLIYERLGQESLALEAYRLSLAHCPECPQARIAYHRLLCRTN